MAVGETENFCSTVSRSRLVLKVGDLDEDGVVGDGDVATVVVNGTGCWSAKEIREAAVARKIHGQRSALRYADRLPCSPDLPSVRGTVVTVSNRHMERMRGNGTSTVFTAEQAPR